MRLRKYELICNWHEWLSIKFFSRKTWCRLKSHVGSINCFCVFLILSLKQSSFYGIWPNGTRVVVRKSWHWEVRHYDRSIGKILLQRNLLKKTGFVHRSFKINPYCAAGITWLTDFYQLLTAHVLMKGSCAIFNHYRLKRLICFFCTLWYFSRWLYPLETFYRLASFISHLVWCLKWLLEFTAKFVNGMRE